MKKWIAFSTAAVLTLGITLTFTKAKAVTALAGQT